MVENPKTSNELFDIGCKKIVIKVKVDRNRSPDAIKKDMEFLTDQRSTMKMYTTEDIDIIYRKRIEHRNELDKKLKCS